MKAVQYGIVEGRFRSSNEYKDGIELEYMKSESDQDK